MDSTDPGHDSRLPRIPLRVAFAGVAALAIMIVGLSFVLTRRGAPARARAIGARLDLSAGEVTVVEGAATARALSGTPLAVGARVATAKGSRALVRTAEGASVFLRGESEVVLADKGIELTRGEAWLEAPGADGEATHCKAGPHAVAASDAGVSLKLEGDRMTVYVARGLATLTSPGGRVEIGAGEQGSALSTGAPTLSPVSFWQDWTGGMGDTRPGRAAAGSGAGRIYGIDADGRPGAPARKLGVARESVRAVLRDGLAETEVDQTFSNPGGTALEGWYWFTVPSQASVTGFALETDGVLVEGEIIERREALARYEAAKRAAVDPALLEWVDGRTYRARIFPIAAGGSRRVVLRYMELLPSLGGKTRYLYPLRAEDPVRLDEFSLSVDLGPEGQQSEVSASLDATVEDGGRRVSMRRSGYVPRADFQLELTQKAALSPVRAYRFEAGSDQADYVMLRYVPDIDFTRLPQAPGEVVVVVDTSAGGDEGARQMRASTAEAVLRALSDQDRFALVALDVLPKVIYPKEGLAPAAEGDIARALEGLSEHAVGGATDLGSLFEPSLERLHGGEQPAIVYVGDGAPTSGETTPDALLDRLRRSLTGSRARLFCVGVGSDAHHELLGQMARAGGGQYFRIDEAEEATGQALRLASAIKTPAITDLDIDLGAGLDQPFLSATGKLSRGEELVLLARTHHPLPERVRIKGRAGGQDFARDYPLATGSGLSSSLVPRLWAAEYVRRLLGTGPGADENRSKVLDLGVEYGLLTPYTSILALDSDGAYARQGIRRRGSRLRGVRLTSLAGDADEREKAALFSPPSLRSMAGCAKSEPAPAPAAREEAPSSNRAAADTESSKDSKAAPASVVPGSPPPTAAAAATQTSSPAVSSIGAPLAAFGSKTTLDDVARQDVPSKGGARSGALPPQRRAERPRPVADPPAAVALKKIAGPPAAVAQNLPSAPVERPRPTPAAKWPLGTCSDASSRPLAERLVLWQKRLRQANSAADLIAQYEAARLACELPDWREQSTLLDLIQQRVQTEEGAAELLTHFVGEPEAARFLSRAILRRTVDPRLSAAVSRVLYGGKVDWARVDRELLDLPRPDERLRRVREAMLVAPGDPSGEVRLVKLLAQTGDRPEALSYGRRLRDRGFSTPLLAQELGDVLSDSGERDEALRTYSEIVEFDGQNPASRQLLGDIFLRHGWYPAAYRQYRTLTDLDPRSAGGWLRLSAAAAGAGRVDEALRIERQVASGEGTPGPDDPRYWARLWSADRLGLLLHDPSAAGGAAATEGIVRKLKELQLFSGPGALAMLSWADLDARLSLGSSDDKADALLGETTDAGSTGLVALLISPEAWKTGKWAARWKSEPRGRAVPFGLVVLSWDGKSFVVNVAKGELGPDDRKALL